MQRIPPIMTSRARQLRREATLPERMLWARLIGFRREGIRFRRQFVAGNYICDFAAPALKLIIEVDGDEHGYPEAVVSDAARDKWLSKQGYRVLRFRAVDVLADCDEVAETILEVVKTLE